MNYKQLKPDLLIRKHKYWHLIEMIPGLLLWSTFLLVILGSMFFPVITANLIILYTLTWVFRTFIFSFNLTRAFRRSKEAYQTDWNELLNYIEHPSKLRQLIKNKLYLHDPQVMNDKDIPLEKQLLKRINYLKNEKDYIKPSQILHCITVVTYKEPYEVLKTSIKSYVNSNYDLSKVILVIAYEKSDAENAEKIITKLKQKYGHNFRKFISTCHPQNLPNELKGRAANATWSAKIFKQHLDQEKIDYNKVILSSFDADTVVSPTYLSELTFRYCTSLDRVKTGYQPVPFFHNNIWDVPIFNRLVAISSSFWQLSVSLRKDENKSFSSRSMSFQSVLDFGYWDAQVVQDDSRQFWTAFFVYRGNHELQNIYSPVYMDAVLSDSYFETIKSQYKQLRRWAWGASDLPFIVFNIWKANYISTGRKIYEIIHFIESIFFWATGPIILLFAGFTPSLVNRDFANSIMSHNLPSMMSVLLNISCIGILISLIITMQILPLKEQKSILKKLSLIGQWVFIPVVSVMLSAIPAIDAQTRLLLNKRLDFQVTIKARKTS